MSSSIVPSQHHGQEKILTLLAHAGLGRRLLPTNWLLDDGRCSCMLREIATDARVCSRSKPGKHPRIAQWNTKASCDEQQIIEWHQWLPLANWGWVQDRTFTLDVDPGRGGLASLEEWELESGGPAPTLTQRTRSGGWHFIYAQPTDDQGGAVKVQGDVLNGIEIRGVGSYIMVDPSPGWTLVDPAIIPQEADELTLALIAKHGIDVGSLGDGVERRGAHQHSGATGDTSERLPSTGEFLGRGFGWFSGSRNRDAYRLAWRLLSQGENWPDVWTNVQIARVMKRCWDMTDQGDAPFTWDECLGTLQSAWRRRELQQQEDEGKLVAMAKSLVGRA